jgi:hypothetical protein
MGSRCTSSDDETCVSTSSNFDDLLSLGVSLIRWTLYGFFFAFVAIEVFLLAFR